MASICSTDLSIIHASIARVSRKLRGLNRGHPKIHSRTLGSLIIALAAVFRRGESVTTSLAIDHRGMKHLTVYYHVHRLQGDLSERIMPSSVALVFVLDYRIDHYY